MDHAPNTDMWRQDSTTVTASGSFAPPRLTMNLPPSNMLLAAAGGSAVGARAGGRDPIMEEVLNSQFSLKIMVGAGRACVFHVGGQFAAPDASDPTAPRVPRWEFFVGDK